MLSEAVAVQAVGWVVPARHTFDPQLRRGRAEGLGPHLEGVTGHGRSAPGS